MRLSFIYIFIFLITFINPIKIKANETKVVLNNNEENNLSEKNLYLIDSGDLIKINFFGAEELNNEYLVMSDGMIYLPYIQPLSLRGLTIDQARVKIEQNYAKELLIPQINISIFQRRPLKISVIGEVQRPGLHVLANREKISSRTPNDMLTVLDAIQAAGGITQDANVKNVSLTRKIPGSLEKYKKTNLDLAQLILKGKQLYNPYLFDGDIIEINKATSANKDIINLSNSTIAPKEITVDVIGEVHKPGKKRLKPNSTANQAIMRAGGIKSLEANNNNINLVRINQDGSMISKKLRYRKNKSFSNDRNPLLLDGDIIIVNPSSYQKISKGVGFVTKPFRGLITAISVYKLLD